MKAVRPIGGGWLKCQMKAVRPVEGGWLKCQVKAVRVPSEGVDAN